MARACLRPTRATPNRTSAALSRGRRIQRVSSNVNGTSGGIGGRRGRERLACLAQGRPRHHGVVDRQQSVVISDQPGRIEHEAGRRPDRQREQHPRTDPPGEDVVADAARLPGAIEPDDAAGDAPERLANAEHDRPGLLRPSEPADDLHDDDRPGMAEEVARLDRIGARARPRRWRRGERRMDEGPRGQHADRPTAAAAYHRSSSPSGSGPPSWCSRTTSTLPTRRPSVDSTVSRKPSTWISSPGEGTPPTRW